MPPKWFTRKAQADARCDSQRQAEPPAKRARETRREVSASSSVRSRDELVAITRSVAGENDAVLEEWVAESDSPMSNGTISDDALVDAINAVVVFSDRSGSIGVLAAQTSDTAYLVTDAVFWPLSRRLAAEISALTTGDVHIDDAIWAGSPNSSEEIVHYATVRGYVLPECPAVPTLDAGWRRALLAEAAADLMLCRMLSGRRFDLPAMAGPSLAMNCDREERPAGPNSEVKSATVEGIAAKLVEDMEAAVLPCTVGLEATVHPRIEACASLDDRLVALAAAVNFQPGCQTRSQRLPALQGCWSSLQEESVRMLSLALQEEYDLRRQIMLRRLDVAVQALCTCQKACEPEVRCQIAQILSSMWTGWRQQADKTSSLSLWSALAASCSLLVEAAEARVSCPHASARSKVKSFRMSTKVPDRGGIPEGSANAANFRRQASASSSSVGVVTAMWQQASCLDRRDVSGAMRKLPQSWFQLGVKRAWES